MEEGSTLIVNGWWIKVCDTLSMAPGAFIIADGPEGGDALAGAAGIGGVPLPANSLGMGGSGGNGGNGHIGAGDDALPGGGTDGPPGGGDGGDGGDGLPSMLNAGGALGTGAGGAPVFMRPDTVTADTLLLPDQVWGGQGGGGGGGGGGSVLGTGGGGGGGGSGGQVVRVYARHILTDGFCVVEAFGGRGGNAALGIGAGSGGGGAGGGGGGGLILLAYEDYNDLPTTFVLGGPAGLGNGGSGGTIGQSWGWNTSTNSWDY